MRVSSVILTILMAATLNDAMAATAEVAPGGSIQTAIDAAAPGDVISIVPGTYRERLTLKDGVSIVGKSRDDVIVETAPAAGNVLLVNGCSSGEVRSITFRHSETPEGTSIENPKAIAGVANSSIVFADCVVRGGAANGIRVEGQGATKIQKCLIEKNALSGVIVAGNTGRHEVLDCTVNENARSGVVLLDCKSARVEGNVIKGNKVYGLWIDDNSALDAKNNDFTDNGQISAFEIRTMRNAKQFDKLESVAARLRRDKLRYPSGGWQLSWYYDYLAEGFRGFGKNEVLVVEEGLKEWQKAYPDSITWRLVQASLYSAQAWVSRGGGYANTVSEEGWRGFRANMDKAWAAMDSAAELKTKDAEYYVKLCEMNMESPRGGGRGSIAGLALDVLTQATGGEKTRASDTAFQDGLKLDPLYGPLYLHRVRELLPRWGGSPAEMMAFANKVSNDLGAENGDAYYALIAGHVRYMEGDEEFLKRYSFSWDQIQNGYNALLKQFPASDYYRNAYARMASINRDAGVATKMFKEIKEPELDIWANTKEFDAYKAWALGTGRLPEKTPLELAVNDENTDRVRKLLASGSDPKSSNAKGETMLAVAIGNRDFATAQALVDAGADINADDSDGNPLTRNAVAESKADTINFFIANKADLNRPDKEGWTPMASAIWWERPHLAQRLVENGADPNAKSTRSPLQAAILRGARDLVPILLEHGADPNGVSGNPNPPLLIAAAKRDQVICRALLDKGADPNGAKADGWTALFEATDKGDLELAKLLVERGADVNKREPDGWNVFHMAVMAGHKPMLDYFLGINADGLHTVPDTKYTLLHTAAKNGRTELVTYLIGKGLDINAKGADGKTPLALAIDGKHGEAVRVLRDAGATK